MKNMGAIVTVCEPDQSSLVEARKLNLENYYESTAQSLPSSLNGQFDLATMFLWNIHLTQYDQVARRLTKLIKPDGKVIIGMHDDDYCNDRHPLGVKPLMEKYFNKVYRTQFAGLWDQVALCCSDIK